MRKAELATFDRVTDAEAKTRQALGEKMDRPVSFGLRELIKSLSVSTGVRLSTVALHNRIADRFIDFHCNFSLGKLTITHLREFSEAYRDMPANTRPAPLNSMGFRSLIKGVKAKNLPSVDDSSRKNHIDTLKPLLKLTPARGFLLANPRAGFEVIIAKTKFSAKKKKVRAPFTSQQAAPFRCGASWSKVS